MLLATSRETLTIPGVRGPAAATLTAATLELTYLTDTQRAATDPWTGRTWWAAGGYVYSSTAGGTVTIEVGPGTVIGALPAGVLHWYLRATPTPNVVIPAGPMYVSVA